MPLNPDQHAYVYILASSFKRLYIGVTTDLMHRVTQHKSKTNPESHTAKYNINKLVYVERFTTITAAIQREKQLKGWLRTRKLELIVSTNPDWRDLKCRLGKTNRTFQGIRPSSTQRISKVITTFRSRHPERSEGFPHSHFGTPVE